MSTITTKAPDNSLRSLIQTDDIRNKMASMLPKHVTADRMIRVCVGAMNKNPKLANCTRESFLECLMQLSQWGLEPDGRRAHLIPYGDKCTLVLDYKGVAELVMRSGVVASLHADIVCENDVFLYDLGQVTKHQIDFRQDRGAIYAVWCRIAFINGGEKHEVMTATEINAIRDKSEGYKAAIKYRKDHPWISHWGEMAKKTVFKRAAKWAPWSAEIQSAIDQDDNDYRTVEGAASRVTVTKADIANIMAPPEPPALEWNIDAFTADLGGCMTPADVSACQQEWSASLAHDPERLKQMNELCEDKRQAVKGGA